MTRRLLLMRHATAEPEAHEGDAARPLAPRGREEAERVARWLRARGFAPVRVVASTARRAEETARLVARATGLGGSAVETDERLYLADADALGYLAAEVARPSAPVLLVGHNPGMAEAVLALAKDDLLPAGTEAFFPPATAAVLDFPDGGPLLGRGALAATVRAREIGA